MMRHEPSVQKDQTRSTGSVSSYTSSANRYARRSSLRASCRTSRSSSPSQLGALDQYQRLAGRRVDGPDLDDADSRRVELALDASLRVERVSLVGHEDVVEAGVVEGNADASGRSGRPWRSPGSRSLGAKPCRYSGNPHAGFRPCGCLGRHRPRRQSRCSVRRRIRRPRTPPDTHRDSRRCRLGPGQRRRARTRRFPPRSRRRPRRRSC